MSAMSAPGRQATLTEGWEAAQDAAEADDSPDTLTDDRVVTTAETCRHDGCGRPAGADGQCPGCRRRAWDDQIGGPRL